VPALKLPLKAPVAGASVIFTLLAFAPVAVAWLFGLISICCAGIAGLPGLPKIAG